MESRSTSVVALPTGLWRWLAMPEIPRALPFVLFVGLGALQGKFFDGSEYWVYGLKTVVAAAALWSLRGYLPEMKWAFSWAALLVGIAIAVLWIALEGVVPTLAELWGAGARVITDRIPEPSDPDSPWNPLAHFADNPALGWAFLAVRVVGRSLVVPALEEVFYRSFFYRSIAAARFNQVPLGLWHASAFVITSLVFGLAHPDQWLPAIVCGAAYQLLVVKKNRLGDAMLAHATTNLIISGYAISTGEWQFT